MLISELQMFEPKDFSGLVTDNHLGAMYATQPIVVSNLIEQIYKVNLGEDLLSFMDQFSTLEIDDDLPFEWWLQGAENKNYPLVSATYTGVKPGIAVTRFTLTFAERAFEASDVIVGEETETYFLRVTKDPEPNGTNWDFEVELVTGDVNLFIPVEELASGKRFSKEYSLVEQTLSKRGGTVYHTSPFKMQNTCSFIRKEYEVPGNMIKKGVNRPLAFAFKDASGKTQTTWIKKLDWDFMKEFRREKALLAMYGQPNKTSQGTYLNKGESGYEIRQGAGLMSQVSPSNVYYYNTFSLDYLFEVLMSLSVGKLPEDSRKFVLGTGEYGFVQFHKAVDGVGANYAMNSFRTAGNVSYNNAGNRITGTGDNLRMGGQFKSYGFLNGIEITLIKIPHFDDITREKAMHPEGGTVKSREYLIMDFGTQSGVDNIQKVVVKGEADMFRYLPGLRDPFSAQGGLTPGLTASTVDGYKVMKGSIMGVKVHNPMRLARFIPNIG